VGSWFSSNGEGPLIEHWDGNAWSASTAPSPAGRVASFTSVAAIPGSTGRLAVGSCLNLDGTSTQAVIERLTGAGWSIAPAHAPAMSSPITRTLVEHTPG
jgi:hypothetical protein